ncbi:MAG: glutamine-hydrolyzing GMP synthase [bacterium]|nr:glutamine-hydrolyzing GMP synthase [bacterium]
MTHQTILILDFGSQYTQLIARRLRETCVYCEIQPFDLSAEAIRERRPAGVILSGGPDSVFDDQAPQLDRGIFDLGIPILGICYGLQLMAHHLGGGVEPASEREYGRAEITIGGDGTGGHGALFEGLGDHETVWMSHGDHITSPPPGFTVNAATANAPVVALENPERKIYGIQFHPEVSHTPSGADILRNFLLGICGLEGDWRMASFLEEAVESIRRQVGDERIICALSGGVDSTVMSALVKRAVGDQLTAIFVDNGVLRKGEKEQVVHNLRDGLGLPIMAIDARRDFLDALAGKTDPEDKRRAIGRVFIDVFDRAAHELEGVKFLAQGTLYPDVIESVSVKGPSKTIKTHHNVGGLPERLGFELVEPLRFLFKDEVRRLGSELGIPEDLIHRHPFPGPGLAVRILGEVTEERVAMLQRADAIFIDELKASGWYPRVSQALAVLLPVKSVGVMGDLRTYEQVVALRSVDTEDFMTADWSQLPYELLGRVANRIVNEVEGVNRVVYDVTSKPPGTIEWE